MRNALVGLATVLVLAAALGVKHGGVQALGSGGDGSYTFMSHQPGNPSAPVTYSSCQPIRVELNLDGAKNRAMAKQLILQAMGEVSAASHLNLVFAGPTERRPRYPDPTLTVEGGAWPVLIAFAEGDEVPKLDEAAGLGGSAYIERAGVRTYVSGQIALARGYWNDLFARPHGADEARAIVMHELGHVVGLGHVRDTGQLMTEHGHGRYELGPGDRRGLELLGKGPCV